MDTPREITERIASRIADDLDETTSPIERATTRRAVVSAIESAIKAERERCAKIAESHKSGHLGVNCSLTIAAAIRSND